MIPSIARPDQYWFTGGIIEDVEWQAGSCDIRLWGGTVRRVEDGDTVMVLRRGLPSVDIVGVEPDRQDRSVNIRPSPHVD